MHSMTEMQRTAYAHACARADDVDPDRFFQRRSGRLTLGLTVNR